MFTRNSNCLVACIRDSSDLRLGCRGDFSLASNGHGGEQIGPSTANLCMLTGYSNGLVARIWSQRWRWLESSNSHCRQQVRPAAANLSVMTWDSNCFVACIRHKGLSWLWRNSASHRHSGQQIRTSTAGLWVITWDCDSRVASILLQRLAGSRHSSNGLGCHSVSRGTSSTWNSLCSVNGANVADRHRNWDCPC